MDDNISGYVFVGTGLGIAYTPSIVILGYYFKDYLEIASGIATSTVGVGVMVFPLLLQYLLDTYSWRGALMIYSGLCFHLCVFGSLMKPSPDEITPKCVDTCKKSIALIDDELTRKRTTSFSQLFRNVRFILYCTSYFFVCAGISSVYMHLQAFAVSSGVERHQSNLLITIMGFGGVISRASSGFILHRCEFSNIVMFTVCMFVSGIAAIFLPLYGSTYSGFVVFAVVFGCFGNIYQTFCGPITIHLVGIDDFPVAYGVLLMTGGTSYLLSPPLTGIDECD